MPRQTITLRDVDIPDGWEPTGELRTPRKGESYLFANLASECDGTFKDCANNWLIILRPKKEREPIAMQPKPLQAFRGDGVTKRDPSKVYLLKFPPHGKWVESPGKSENVFEHDLWYVELPPILDPPEPETQLRQVPGWEVKIIKSQEDYWWQAEANGASPLTQRSYSKTKREAVEAWNKFARDFLVGGKDGGA